MTHLLFQERLPTRGHKAAETLKMLLSEDRRFFSRENIFLYSKIAISNDFFYLFSRMYLKVFDNFFYYPYCIIFSVLQIRMDIRFMLKRFIALRYFECIHFRINQIFRWLRTIFMVDYYTNKIWCLSSYLFKRVFFNQYV